MRRALLALALCFSMVANAAPQRFLEETQILTRADPTLSTEGMNLSQVVMYRIMVCAATGGALITSGKVRFWLYDPDWTGGGQWAPNFNLEYTLIGGKHCEMVVGDLIPAAIAGQRVLPVSVGITVSAGTQVIFRLTAILKGEVP